MGKFGEINEVLVILKDHSTDAGADANGDFDISNKFSVMEYEDAQPQSVKITLNARGGRFLTTAPILRKRDRIYIEITDKNGNVTKDVFHVRNIKRIRGGGKGLSLLVTCPHQSENLWKSTISYKKRGKRISGNRALEIIKDDLNNNKGSKDPYIEIPAFNVMTKTGNRFDENTSNNYFFESKKCKSAIDEIKDIELQPVEGGGSFEPMYVRFVSKYDHSTGSYLDIVQLQAFPQGYQGNAAGEFVNIPNLTLVHPKLGSGKRPNILSLNTDEDPEEGTNLVAIGDKSSGSWPKDWSMYFGARYVFDSAREFRLNRDYKIGHLVKRLGLTYECVLNHNSDNDSRPPNAVYWVLREFVIPAAWNSGTSYNRSDIVKHQNIAYKNLSNANRDNEPGLNLNWVRVHFAPTTEYSPLTKNKVQYWVNALAGAKNASINNGRVQMIDPNVIIDDSKHPRTYVRWVGKDPADIPAEHLVNGRIPDAYKALVLETSFVGKDGTGAEIGEGLWSGNDKNGLPYAGNIVQYDDKDLDGNGEWLVFKGKQTLEDQEVFNWDEGQPWVKNPCKGDGTDLDVSGIDFNSVCTFGNRDEEWVTGSYFLIEIPFAGQIGRFSRDRQFDCAHSVKWDNSEDNQRIDMSNEGISEIDTANRSAVFIKSKPSLNFFETGVNTFYVGFNFWSLWPLTSNSEPFGSVTAGELISLPTFDIDNMDLTRNGTSEWFGPLVEEYYPFQSFAMMLNLRINDAISSIFEPLDGDFTIGMFLVDRQDNVMTLEFPHARNGKTLFAQGDLSKLKGYKGVPGIAGFFSAEEPNPTVAFDSTEIVFGGIYTKDSFDVQGRYGYQNRFTTKNEMKMSIDGWRFIKPLVATNVDENNNKPAANIETLTIDKTSITNHAQLKNYVLGLEKFLNFDRRSFVVEVINGRKIEFGDSVYLTDSEAINDSDDAVPNTVKVVANKITITLTKPKNGAGGFKKNVELVKRVWPNE